MEHKDLLDAILVAVGEGGGDLSRKQICNRLGMSKAPHVCLACEELVEMGKLVKWAGRVYGHLDCWFYSLPSQKRKLL
jgi:hypothetical protein